MALTTAFCANGNKTTIPQTSQDGSVSYDQGFGASYALPPEEGGKFIDREQFNQLMYDTTSAVITNKNNIATIQGDVTTAKANITTIQGQINGLESDVESVQNTINQVISADVAPIGVYKTVNNKTIGANGDFKTIQEAFTYVQTHQKQSLNQNLTLTLLEDLSVDLYFKGAWYPYLTIDCNGFKLANKLTIDLSCFIIKNLKLSDYLLISLSTLWLSGNINISYQSNEYPKACITAVGGSLVYMRGDNYTFSTTSDKSAILSQGNGIIFLEKNTTITQATGANCFACYAGGIIQLNPTLNLAGVTVPKTNQTANVITNNGIIIGDYYNI